MKKKQKNRDKKSNSNVFLSNKEEKMFGNFVNQEFNNLFIIFKIFDIIQIIYFYFLNECYDNYKAIFYCQNKKICLISMISHLGILILNLKNKLSMNIIFLSIISVQFSNISLIECNLIII